MNIFSKKSKEKDAIQQDSENSGSEDIQFEEVVDIDEIQKKLQAKIYEIEPPDESSESFELKTADDDSASSENKPEKPLNPQNKIDSNSKKYVIYVDQDNIDFMENLSVNERKVVINKILKEQNEVSIKTKEFNERKRFLKHAVLACFTFIIGFPIMFIGVNKAMEATIDNYKQAKDNVMKLYKDNGKIKVSNPDINY